MKVKMNWTERLMLPQAFPPKDTYLALKLASDISNKIVITQEEQDLWGLEDLPTGGIRIKPEMAGKTDKEFEFTELEIKKIKKQLKELDDKKELIPQLVRLFEQVVNDETINEEQK